MGAPPLENTARILINDKNLLGEGGARNAPKVLTKLQTIINAWIDRFTSFLYDNTTKQMNNIQGFVSEVQSGIKVLPKDLNTDRDK